MTGDKSSKRIAHWVNDIHQGDAIDELGRASGLDVKRYLLQYRESLGRNALYDNLYRLVELGLATRDLEDGRTHAYELTEQGEVVVAEDREWRTD